MCNQDTGITGINNISEQDTGITGIYNKYNMKVLLSCNNIFPAINGNMDMIVIRQIPSIISQVFQVNQDIQNE